MNLNERENVVIDKEIRPQKKKIKPSIGKQKLVQIFVNKEDKF